MINASAFIIESQLGVGASVTVNGQEPAVKVGSNATVTIPITASGFPAGTQVYPAVDVEGGTENGNPCIFEPSGSSATYQLVANEYDWVILGPTQS